MIARQLISPTLPPLKSTDSGAKALLWMADFQVKHLPIVNKGKYVGLISEEMIYDADNGDLEVGNYDFSRLQPKASPYNHIYEVLKLTVDLQLTIIPVVDNNEEYQGAISIDKMLFHFAKMSSITEPGSILVLEIPRRDYSMAEIARIVESEKTAILSSYVSFEPDAQVVDTTLKLNRREIQHIVATFQRFGYKVKASFEESDYMDSLKDRYDALMSYLNV